MKIIVADDSRVMRQIVIRTLRQAGWGGHEIVEAANGRECLEQALASPPDLILSDWNMPEMSGIDCLAALRAAGSTVPFGFVTSEGSEEMRARATATGASFLIAKPFTPESFDEVLSGAVGGQR